MNSSVKIFSDDNNRLSNSIPFMSAVNTTSDHLHRELVRFLFFADSSRNLSTLLGSSESAVQSMHN
jgi:hypothetical protein